MNIIVHYPKGSEGLELLQKKVAVIHAEAVIRYIQKLSCPKEQKLDLINSLKAKDCSKMKVVDE